MKNLKDFRKEKKLTQTQLAAQLGVTQQLIAKWEKGVTVPTIQRCKDIANALEVNVSEIVDCFVK